MKTAKEILQDLTADFISLQDKVKFFGKDGAARAILSAAANTTSELWNDLTQAIRGLYPETSQGAKLDNTGGRRGLVRKTATKASAVLLFNGPEGTVIPEGTKVKSVISGVSYLTKQAVTLGTANPDLQRPVNSNVLGDVVIAESELEGSKTKVNAQELKQFETPIDGVTVTNLFPSEGGEDTETDEQFRQRIFLQADILSQGTQAFYEALAKKADGAVLRSLARYNPLTGGIDITVVKDNGGTFSAGELTAIQEYIYPRQKAMQPIKALNVTYKTAEVEAEALYSGDIEPIFTDIASRMAEIFNFRLMSFGSRVKFSDVLKVFLDTKTLEIPDITKIKLNGGAGDIQAGSLELIKIISLKITTPLAVKAGAISQKYTTA
ncbi:MAG TPA: baseplate J/gp47 family protein [Ignavibacteriales bacterium]|nr:baseplate J/gp47 family protein [Ignavibacteriales bacterium]